jgi:hypothetical protein
MTTITYPNSKLVFTDENGNTGTTILPESITTPSITVSSITDSNGSTGASGYVLSSTGDGIAWIPQTSGIGTITSDLNMNTRNITNVNELNCTNLNATTIFGNTGTTFSNQISFSSSPFCSVSPSASTDVANKSYVDTALVSGNYNLFLNQSQLISVGNTGFSVLSNRVSSTIQASPISTSVPANSTRPIISFITDEINILQLTSSIFNLNVYGNNITGNHSIYYTFNLEIYRGGTILLLGTSESSAILNNTAAFPLMYTMAISTPTTTTFATDRIILELYAINKSTTTSVTLNTYFENNWYSYLQLQSNSINPFQFSQWINTATSNLNMNGYNISSTGDLSISCPTKILTLGNQSPTINLSSTTSDTINIGSSIGSINLWKPITINTTNNISNVTAGWGDIKTKSLSVVGFPGGNVTTITRTCTIEPGVWFVHVYAGLYVTVVGILSDIGIIIEKDGIYVAESQYGRGYTPILNQNNGIIFCSGIFSTTTTSTISFVQRIRRTATQNPPVAQVSSYMPYPMFVRIG